MNRFFIFFNVLLSLSFPLQAQDDIPQPLKPWTTWVLDGSEHVTCPFINNANYLNKENHLCAWSGKLSIDAQNSGAAFEQYWQVLVESFIPLPGDEEHWPESVTVNNKALPIINHANKPSIKLRPGEYRIKGIFNWTKVPANIDIPANIALVELHVNQDEVLFPKIDNNELWFQESAQNESELDAVEIDVVRRMSDGPHLLSETIVSLDVSGKSREVILGQPLLNNFKLIGLKGSVPAFLDADGLLHAKVKPGEWDIVIQAYAPPETLSWSRPPVSHQWPKDEVWVFSTNEKMRIGKLNGAKLIDNSQVDMPNHWYNLPSYLVTTEDTITYDVQHRGKPLHLENQLSLKRTLWMSFDKSIYTFNDHIEGDMIEGWRLSLLQPFTLESAEDQDGSVLITTLDEQERGIENRYPEVDVFARGIIDYSGQLPVAGWDSDFERVSIDLNIPPGNKLFAVFGADRATDTWWGNWSIWSSFIVLLASIVAGRLISIIAGIATGIMLLMIYQESGAPVIASLNLLAAITIHKHQPFDRLKVWINAYWVTSTVIAVGAILFFSATQIRTVIHPQLASKNTTYSSNNFSDKSLAANKTSPILEVRQELASTQLADTMEKITVTGSRVSSVPVIERYQSDALIQAGSGVPNWQWNSHRISWSSPVAAGQTFDIIVLSATVYRILKILSILVIALWLYSVSKDALLSIIARIKQQHITASIALLLLSPFYSTTTEADELPSQALLAELKERLTQAPLCAPQCASINHLNVKSDRDVLTLTISVHATARTAVALPRSEFWRAETLMLNKEPLQVMVKEAQWIYIPVELGISIVTLKGRIASADNFQLQFKEQPQTVSIQPSEVWEIVGNSENNTLTGNTLEFIATAREQNDEQPSTRYNTQPFVQVKRVIALDQFWRVTTVVKRIAPATGSVNLHVPLLDGERILTGDTKIEDNHVVITIPAGVDSVSWRSNLFRKEAIELKATDHKHMIEQWQLIASPSWHTKLSGPPVILEQQEALEYFVYNFYPYTNETIRIEASRPDAVEGNVLAIDSVTQTIEHGTRTSKMTLSFTYRSTRGGEHIIKLPTNYQLKEIKSDNRLINQQPEAGLLAIPILPGEHNVNVVMRATVEEAIAFATPTVDLNAPSSNITTIVNMNNQRWILWTDGPLLGPAILYWVEFLAFVLTALLLSKVRFSPLSTVGWIILGVGLSLNNWGILMLTALWFASLTASKYRPANLNHSTFNVSQTLLYALSIITILALITIVPTSLLSSPSMGIEGYQSYGNHLAWFADKSDGVLPKASVFSVSTWFYKAMMLVWVIWLSISLVNWVKWAWRTLGEQGYWRTRKPKNNTD
jgi:hypothetical protein